MSFAINNIIHLMSLQSKKNGQLRFVSDMGTSNGSLNKNIIKTPVINLKKGKSGI